MASLPKFTEDIRKFLNNDENETFIEELKRGMSSAFHYHRRQREGGSVSRSYTSANEAVSLLQGSS